ncbi:MAG: lasso peptide biosynthesis B2 protein [bacterium]
MQTSRTDTSIPLGWRLRACAATAIIPPLLELVSLTRFDRLVLTADRSRISNAPDDFTSARWVDNALTGLRGPWVRTCLRRSAVLYYLLRAAGRSVDLCIGVRRDEAGRLVAHAWLLRGDVPYLEPEATRSVVEHYDVIARFPRAAAVSR